MQAVWKAGCLDLDRSTHLKGSQALFVHFVKLSLQCSRDLRLRHFNRGRGRATRGYAYGRRGKRIVITPPENINLDPAGCAA